MTAQIPLYKVRSPPIIPNYGIVKLKFTVTTTVDRRSLKLPLSKESPSNKGYCYIQNFYLAIPFQLKCPAMLSSLHRISLETSSR